MEAELKIIENAEVLKELGTTGSVTLVNGVANGTDYTDRIGRRFFMKKLQLVGFVKPNDLVNTFVRWRILVVYDRNPNSGSTPAVTDILSVSSSISFMNWNNRERFVIIHDISGVSSYEDYTGTGGLSAFVATPSVHDINIDLNLNSLITTNSGTGATLASISSGALYVVTTGSVADAQAPALAYKARVYFTDA